MSRMIEVYELVPHTNEDGFPCLVTGYEVPREQLAEAVNGQLLDCPRCPKQVKAFFVGEFPA